MKIVRVGNLNFGKGYLLGVGLAILLATTGNGAMPDTFQSLGSSTNILGNNFRLMSTDQPPMPCYPPLLRGLDLPVYLSVESGFTNCWVDDRAVDYGVINALHLALLETEIELGLMSGQSWPPSPGEGEKREDEQDPPVARAYGSNELWLEISLSTNAGFADLTLHNTRSNLFYQLNSTRNLTNIDWIPGEIVTNTAGLTNLTFKPLPMTNFESYFRAVGADTLVSIEREFDAFEPNSTNALSERTGIFVFRREAGPSDVSIPIHYLVQGTADNGVDYRDDNNSPLSGVETVFGSFSFSALRVNPIEDDLVEFDETVTLRILVTNTYVIDPSNFQTTITLSDPPEKLFSVVANLITVGDVPAGIDYYSPSNWLVFSMNNGAPFNFWRVDTNGVVTNWSGIQGLRDEKKIAIAHATANGFTNGTMYFGSGADVGRLSANGVDATPDWIPLTNGFGTNATLLRGSLHVDSSGSFGGRLLVVSGGEEPHEGGGVWSISATGEVSVVATIPDTHLEGLITLTNDPARWGPWAGKMLVGGEWFQPAAIFAIDPSGTVQTNHIDSQPPDPDIVSQNRNHFLQPEDFDIIQPNQNLYCLDQQQSGILKLSSNLLTNFVGDLLVTQEGFIDSFAKLNLTPNNHLPKLVILHWNGTNIVTRATISRHEADWFEHATFAPIDIPKSAE